MTFQRKLLLGFSLMALPALLVGAEAIRSNALERRALEALGGSLARNRTYADVENAMFDQTEAIWRHLTGLDPEARQEWRLGGEVVDYWLDRWSGQLPPEQMDLANGVRQIQREIRAVGDSVHRPGRRRASAEARTRSRAASSSSACCPSLARVNREIYRRTRESSVQRAFTRVEQIVDTSDGCSSAIFAAASVTGLLASWLITRSLAAADQRASRCDGAWWAPASWSTRSPRSARTRSATWPAPSPT